jgi:hypothetical protein
MFLRNVKTTLHNHHFENLKSQTRKKYMFHDRLIRVSPSVNLSDNTNDSPVQNSNIIRNLRSNNIFYTVETCYTHAQIQA